MDVILNIIIAIVSRIVPHAPNFTAVGAVGVMAGHKLSFKKAIIIMLSSMLVSDLLLGFHGAMWATYFGMIFYVFAGRFVTGKKSLYAVISAAAASSVFFFIITNFAVWANTAMYSKDIGGIIRCYIAALPFFRNTIAGDLVYTTIFAVGWKVTENIFKNHAPVYKKIDI